MFYSFQFCGRACLEGKDNYKNMQAYMAELNAILGDRKLSSGEAFELLLGGEWLLFVDFIC